VGLEYLMLSTLLVWVSGYVGIFVSHTKSHVRIARSKRNGTRAETRFRLSPKRTSPFKSAGTSGQSTSGSRGVRISFSNAGYTMFRGSVRVLATQSIRQFPLHFPSRASPCAIRFQTHYTCSLVAMGKLALLPRVFAVTRYCVTMSLVQTHRHFWHNLMYF